MGGGKIHNADNQVKVKQVDNTLDTGILARMRLRGTLPKLWTIIILVAFGLNTMNLAINHPEQVRGWRAVGLAVLLICLLRTFRWLSWGRIYHDDGISERSAMLLVGVQLLTLLVLVKGYDTSFASLGLPLLYQIIGGLSQRHWLVPLTGLVLIFA